MVSVACQPSSPEPGPGVRRHHFKAEHLQSAGARFELPGWWRVAALVDGGDTATALPHVGQSDDWVVLLTDEERDGWVAVVCDEGFARDVGACHDPTDPFGCSTGSLEAGCFPLRGRWIRSNGGGDEPDSDVTVWPQAVRLASDDEHLPHSQGRLAVIEADHEIAGDDDIGVERSGLAPLGAIDPAAGGLEFERDDSDASRCRRLGLRAGLAGLG